MDQGEMAESVSVTASLLGSQPGSQEHSQRTLGVPGSHSDTGDTWLCQGATRDFPSLSLSRRLARQFQAVRTGAGETTKQENAAQISPGFMMVLQREQRWQLTAKEIWA